MTQRDTISRGITVDLSSPISVDILKGVLKDIDKLKVSRLTKKGF
jgi:hypothetical protein